MDQRIERAKILAIDPQQIIRLSGQCPGRDDLWVARHGAGKFENPGRFMRGHLDLNKGLNIKPQSMRGKPRRIALDIALCLKPLAPAPGLRRGKVQRFAQLLGGQMGILLQGGQKARIYLINHMRVPCAISQGNA